MQALYACCARSEEGLVVSYYRSPRGDVPYWGGIWALKDTASLKELRELSTAPQIIPTQEIGGEYRAIPANEHAATPSQRETRALNLNLIADIFPAKESALISRLKCENSWSEYKGPLRYELNLSAFELFSLQYYGVFYIPSLLECPRSPAQNGNCVLEMDYDGLTLQGSQSIWTSPYHIFRCDSVKLVDDKVHVYLSSTCEIEDEDVKPSLSKKLRLFLKNGSKPFESTITGKKLLARSKELHV